MAIDYVGTSMAIEDSEEVEQLAAGEPTKRRAN